MVELIPSAKRLIKSLRDIGYEFENAVADIVDNSIEAGATIISINLNFAGENSYLTIADNGLGMAPKEIWEALRFGSNRRYDESDDLGRYGLGLKTASLSQCERLTVSSRRGEVRARINSYCWDLQHIEATNKWEILWVENENLKPEILNHLKETPGTVITWERLGRLLGYKYPTGEYARKQSEQMVATLKAHLGMVYHRFLSGRVNGKRIAIYVNSEKIDAWDPYSRGERYTQTLDQIKIPLEFRGKAYDVTVQPYILPPQALYSSPKAHLEASGPGRWNKQQGLYIYRSNRIIQAGGWGGLRTSDEHTKLARIAVLVPAQLDELFQFNVAKRHASLPRELRGVLLEQLQPVIQKAQSTYRERELLREEPALASQVVGGLAHQSIELRSSADPAQGGEGEGVGVICGRSRRPPDEELDSAVEKTAISFRTLAQENKLPNFLRDFYNTLDETDRKLFRRLLLQIAGAPVN
jgi:hypothetical protein